MTDDVPRAAPPPALTPYLLLGFVALVLALTARAPASLLQRVLPASGSGIQVSAWGGTVWNGQAAVNQSGEAGLWRWNLIPSALLLGRIAFQVDASGMADLHGRLDRGIGGWAAHDLHGTVPARLLQPLLPPGWSLPGDVRLAGIDLARRGLSTGAWSAAAGQFRWAGGAMQLSLGSQVQSATLPPLIATLHRDGDRLQVSLVEEAGGASLADVAVAPDGSVETKLRERLLRYSGRTSGANPDSVVVTSVQRPH
ncbi:MAG TPA: type II secretion system protein N [Moraxellaceae bacterium]|nr:type II secretion system protein N [Moraxellaceae bacterium]